MVKARLSIKALGAGGWSLLVKLSCMSRGEGAGTGTPGEEKGLARGPAPVNTFHAAGERPREKSCCVCR